jgi:hypothetical protein
VFVNPEVSYDSLDGVCEWVLIHAGELRVAVAAA